MKVLSRVPTVFCFLIVLLPVVSIAQAPNTVDSYLYLSQIERIYNAHMEEDYVGLFRNGDTLDAAIRSNDYIYIFDRPIFLGPVFTSQDSFMELRLNAYFMYEPQMGVPEFEFPFVMEEMRAIAEEQNLYFPGESSSGTRWQSQVEALEDRFRLTQWLYGSELSPETIANMCEMSYDEGLVIYIDSDLRIFGSHLMGSATIVCDGQVKIMDDLKYAAAEVGAFITIPEDSTATFGLISSGDILVGNTDANGKGNGGNQGDENDHSNKHCVITGSLVSLNGSFSFENKNFFPSDARFDGFQWCDSLGEHATEQDYRGTIFMKGSLAFHRRDYYRTSNCGRTGYDRVLKYDSRLEELTPPLFDTVVNVGEENGNAPVLPVTHTVEKAYPNPFNSSFNLNMTLAKRDQVRIRLVNILGQEVFSQDFGWMDKGLQRFNISIPDKPAGLYFTEITTSSGFTNTSKVVFIK